MSWIKIFKNFLIFFVYEKAALSVEGCGIKLQKYFVILFWQDFAEQKTKR